VWADANRTTWWGALEMRVERSGVMLVVVGPVGMPRMPGTKRLSECAPPMVAQPGLGTMAQIFWDQKFSPRSIRADAARGPRSRGVLAPRPGGQAPRTTAARGRPTLCSVPNRATGGVSTGCAWVAPDATFRLDLQGALTQISAIHRASIYRSKFNVPLQIESQGFCIVR
jgi:hypothetical protein